MLDSGATASICSDDFFQIIKNNKLVVKTVKELNKFAISASGDRIKFAKEALIHFKIAHLSWTFKFLVAPKLPVPVILGTDFLHKTRAIIDMGQLEVTFPYGDNIIMAMTPSEMDDDEDDQTYKVGDNLTPNQVKQVKNLIDQFPDTITKRLGKTNLIEYEIKLKSNQPVRGKTYQFNPIKMEALREHVEELLSKGIIKPSTSPYGCPAFLVPKKGNKTRMVVNYKPVNDLIQLESTPTPTVENAFVHLGKAKFFTLLDLNSAYLQIPLAEASKEITTFLVPWGAYAFERIPFGLST